MQATARAGEDRGTRGCWIIQLCASSRVRMGLWFWRQCAARAAWSCSAIKELPFRARLVPHGAPRPRSQRSNVGGSSALYPLLLNAARKRHSADPLHGSLGTMQCLAGNQATLGITRIRSCEMPAGCLSKHTAGRWAGHVGSSSGARSGPVRRAATPYARGQGAC